MRMLADALGAAKLKITAAKQERICMGQPGFAGKRLSTPAYLYGQSGFCKPSRLNAGNVFPYAGSMNSLLAHPDGDDAVAVLLQGHAAVVISVGTSLSTHGSALGVIAPREGIGATRQTQRSEQQQ